MTPQKPFLPTLEQQLSSIWQNVWVFLFFLLHSYSFIQNFTIHSHQRTCISFLLLHTEPKVHLGFYFTVQPAFKGLPLKIVIFPEFGIRNVFFKKIINIYHNLLHQNYLYSAGIDHKCEPEVYILHFHTDNSIHMKLLMKKTQILWSMKIS